MGIRVFVQTYSTYSPLQLRKSIFLREALTNGERSIQAGMVVQYGIGRPGYAGAFKDESKGLYITDHFPEHALASYRGSEGWPMDKRTG
jgi:hypothetical protein